MQALPRKPSERAKRAARLEPGLVAGCRGGRCRTGRGCRPRPSRRRPSSGRRGSRGRPAAARSRARRRGRPRRAGARRPAAPTPSRRRAADPGPSRRSRSRAGLRRRARRPRRASPSAATSASSGELGAPRRGRPSNQRVPAPLTRTTAAGGSRSDELARRVLAVGCDGVLEVGDDGVGLRRERLRQLALVASRARRAESGVRRAAAVRALCQTFEGSVKPARPGAP